LIAIYLLPLPAFAGEKVIFYTTDPAGTPVAMTDSTGNVVWRADYKPFGEEQSVAGNHLGDVDELVDLFRKAGNNRACQDKRDWIFPAHCTT
jgi:hypothetical protein